MDQRAPLPPEHLTLSDNDGQVYLIEYEAITKHLLCRMFMSSQMMELGSESRFTSLIVFHRYVRHFYKLVNEQKQTKIGVHRGQHEENSAEEMRHIIQHLGQVAAACLFLGCKMSEEPRRIRDVINLSTVLGFSEVSDFIDTDKDNHEIIQVIESAEPPPLDNKYWSTKEDIVSTEQQVLRMLQFDALVCHPYRCVLIVMDTLGFGTGVNKTDENGKHADSTQTNTFLTPGQSDQVIADAWIILNETSLDAKGGALVYPVAVLACAAIQVAAEGISTKSDHGEVELHDDTKEQSTKEHIELPKLWWRVLDLSSSDMHEAMSSLRKILDS